MRRSKNVAAAFVIFVLVFAVSDLDSAQCPQLNKSAADQKILRIAFGTNVVSLNPVKQLDLISSSVLSNIYDALFYSEGISKNARPMLVTSYERINPTTWRFKLREGVLFQNGDPFDAVAVKFSLDYQRNPSKSKWAGHLSSIKEVRIVNDHAIDIVTDRSIMDLPRRLRFGYNFIMSLNHYHEVGGSKLGEQPMGTGPYRYDAVSDRAIRLVRNDGYWGSKPRYNVLEYHFIPNDDERVRMLIDGNIDVIAHVNPKDSMKLLKNPRMRIAKALTPRVVFMEFVDGIYPRRGGEGLFHNESFREALNRSIDRDAIAKYVLRGNGMPQHTVASPLFSAHDSALSYQFDKERARQLLKESGYDASDEIVVITPKGRYPMDYEVAKAVVYYFSAIGVNAVLREYEDWREYQSILHGKRKLQRYISLIGFGVIDLKSLLTFYFGRDWERNRFRDVSLMEKINEVEYAISDEERIGMEREIVKYIYDHSYVMPLYNVINVYAARKGLVLNVRNDELLNARVIGGGDK